MYDKQVDFDRLDFLTKRFNRNTIYSQLAKTAFDDLNKLSEIPIYTERLKNSRNWAAVLYTKTIQKIF